MEATFIQYKMEKFKPDRKKLLIGIRKLVSMYLAAGYVYFVTLSLMLEKETENPLPTPLYILCCLVIGYIMSPFVFSAILSINQWIHHKEKAATHNFYRSGCRLFRWSLVGVIILQLQITAMSMFLPELRGIEVMENFVFYPILFTNAIICPLFFSHLDSKEEGVVS